MQEHASLLRSDNNTDNVVVYPVRTRAFLIIIFGQPRQFPK